MKLEHYVGFSLAMIILMTIAVVVLTVITGDLYGDIYTVFCGIFGGEILSCALIKIFKLKEHDDDNVDG